MGNPRSVPFQVEVGDFFGFFSQRTFSGSLKGAQIELQPNLGSEEWQSSFVLFGGSRLDNYRTGGAEDDLSIGGSWLMGDQGTGFSINYVHNRKDPDGNAGKAISGNTASIAYNQRVQNDVFGDLRLNAELGWHSQEALVGGVENEADDFGLFLKLDGSDGPMTYSAKFEQYNENYNPAGAAISANRRTLEGNVGWRFDNGLAARARAQHFRDQLEAANPTDTYVAGVNLSGPADWLGIENWSFSTDAFVQTVEDKNGAQDRQTANLNLNLSGALDQDWSMRGSLLLTVLHDGVKDQNGDTEQATIGFTRRFEYDGFQGSFDVGGSLRHDDAAGQDQYDFGPNISVNAAKGNHSFNISYSTLFQDPIGQNGDNAVHSLAANYRLTEGPHGIGVEGEVNRREPRLGAQTDSFKLGVSYTFSFLKPESGPATQPASASAPVRGSGPGVDLTAFTLGASADDAYDAVADAGLSGAAPFPDGIAFDYPVFDDLSERQRIGLVLSRDRATLDKMIAVIDLDRVGGQNDAERLYQIIQAKLAQQYGRPRETKIGDFSANLAEDLAAGRFVRNSDWRLPGGILRFGLPRRTDRVIRFEIQYAKSLPPSSDPNWSMETLR